MAGQVEVAPRLEAARSIANGWVNAGDAWDWGKGITTFNGGTRGSAVEIKGAIQTRKTTTTRIYLAESREDVYQALDVEVSTSASYGLAHASGSFQLAESVHTTGFDLFLVVASSVRYPRGTGQAQLTAEAKQLLTDKQYAAFVRQFGDRFIDGMQFGALYAGILQIHAQSEDVRRRITTALALSGGSGDLEASIQAKVTQTTNSYRSFMSTEAVQYAWGGEPEVGDLNVGDMITTALGFADTVTPENAWPMYAHLTDYTELNLPHATEFADYADLFRRPGNVLTQRARDQRMLEDRLTTSRFAHDHPESYAAPASAVRALVAGDVGALPGLIDSIDAGTTAYAEELQRALVHEQDPTAVPQPPEYSLPGPIAMPAHQTGVAYTIRSGTGYRLAPAAGDGTVALDVWGRPQTYGPGVVLTNADDSAVEQRWMISPTTLPSTGSAVLELGFVNGADKASLSAKTIKVTTGFTVDYPVVGLFTHGTVPMWNVSVGDGRMAIRLDSNWDLNLNAIGNAPQPGTVVGLWRWGGGTANEVWYCDPVTPAAPVNPTPRAAAFTTAAESS